MGEFEDETVSDQVEDTPIAPQPEPVEDAPIAPQPEPVEDAPLSLFAEEAAVGPVPAEAATVSEDDAIAAIHAELSDEVSEAAAEEPSGAEPALDEPPTDETAPTPAEPAVDAADAELSDDDLAAAIAASSEAVGTDATLDDIAPGTRHIVSDEEPVLDDLVRYGAPWWPYLVYLGLWIALAGVAIWQFQQLATGTVLYETEQYTMLVFAGLVLAAAGVVLIPAVWLGARVNPKRHRAGLFTSAFVKGAAFILIGMLVWWGTLMALDYLRLGRMI